MEGSRGRASHVSAGRTGMATSSTCPADLHEGPETATWAPRSMTGRTLSGDESSTVVADPSSSSSTSTEGGGRNRTTRRAPSGFACRVPFVLGLVGLAVVCLVTAVNGSVSGGGAPAAPAMGTGGGGVDVAAAPASGGAGAGAGAGGEPAATIPPVAAAAAAGTDAPAAASKSGMGSLFGSLLESAGLGKGSTGGAAVEAQGVAKEGAAAAPSDAPATPVAGTGTGDAAKQGGAAAPAHPHTGPTTTAGAAAAASGQQHGQAHASASLSSLPSLSVKPVSSTPGHAQQAHPHLPPQPPAQPPAKPMKQAEVNYAAEKAGAVVLGASEALVGAKHLLDDDRDKYARSPCDQDKWVVINLSEDIRVHAIVLANYEKFSSTVKDFQVLYSVQSPNLAEDEDEEEEEGAAVADPNAATPAAATATTAAAAMSDDAAVAAAAKGTNASGSSSGASSSSSAAGSGAVAGGQKKGPGTGGWQELGTFQAREKAGEQRFEVTPPRYARYLKVRFLTHWSKEFYCTLSQIKVYGSTLQQGFMDDWHKSKLHLGSHLDAIDAIQPDAVEPQGTVAEKEEAGGGGGGGAAPAGGAAGKGEGTGSSSEGGSGPGSDAPSTQPPQKTKEEVVDAAVAAPVAPADPVAGEEQSPNGTAAAAAAVCEGSPDQTCVSRPVEPAAVAVPAQQHQEEDGAKQAEAEQPPHGKGPTPAEPATGGEAPSKPDDAAAPTPLAPAEEAARVASKEPAEKAPVPESGGAVGGEKPAEEEEAVPPLSQHGQTQLEAKEPQHPQQQKQPPLPVPPAPDAKQDRGEGAAPPAPSDGASVGSEQPAQAPPAAAAAEPPKAATAKEGGEPPKQQQQQQLPGSGAGMEPQEPAGVPAAGVAAGAEEDAAGAGAKPAVESPPAAAATPLSPSGGTASTSGSTSSSMPPATATLIPVVEVEPVPRPPPQPQPQQPPPQSPATTTTSTVVATINDAAAKTELMSRFRHQCLQQMRLGDFRKQKLAKLQEDLRVKGGAAASSLGSGSPYDNIFKTLMDEMTSLEINQSIFDVYVSNLHSCFVQVVDDVLLEQERARLDFAQTVAALQTRLLQAGEAQDALLRRLQRLETNFLASFAAWIIPCLLALLLLACSFLCVGRRGRHGGFGRDGAGPLAAGMGVASAGYYAAADNGPAARGGVEGAAGVVGAGGGAVANGGHHHVHYPS